MVAAIVWVLGDPSQSIEPLPWWRIQLASALTANMKQLVELKYLWDQPIRLNNSRLLATRGEEPHTPLDEAVRATFDGIMNDKRPIDVGDRL